MMKENNRFIRITAVLCVIFTLLSLFGGCETKPEEETKDGKLKIMTSVFPAYDLARQVCGDSAEVDLLLPPGSEAHTYEPTAKELIRLSGCDLFICVGGESEKWLDDVISSLGTGVRVLKMMDCVETALEENGEAEEEPEYDEHVWTSPVNAVKIANAICREVCAIDAENENRYKENTDLCETALYALDTDFRKFFAEHDVTLIFGDRFPILYFTREYNVPHLAVFPGCSSETEPSAAILASLIDEVKEKDIPAVFYIEFSNHKVADAIAEATGAKTALFHTCHNVTPEEFASGVTYLSLMRQNLNTLAEAFS